MTIRSIVVSLLLASAAAGAQAHTHLEGSVPADKSRVKSPAAIELQFSEAALVTALTLQMGKDAAVPLKPLPAKPSEHASIPVKALAPGDYVVSWRVAGDDGHVMSGKFGFSVDPAAPAAKASSHDGMGKEDHAHMDMDHMKAEDKKTPNANEPKH